MPPVPGSLPPTAAEAELLPLPWSSRAAEVVAEVEAVVVAEVEAEVEAVALGVVLADAEGLTIISSSIIRPLSIIWSLFIC